MNIINEDSAPALVFGTYPIKRASASTGRTDQKRGKTEQVCRKVAFGNKTKYTR